ncbi:MAG: GntR family transcriptional regulator [Glycocaulis sp.]
MNRPHKSWQSIRETALTRIRSGDWPAGQTIPREADLADELGCARATVNRALQSLADEGYLDRKRKGGTRVTATPVRKAVFEIAIIRQQVEQRGAVHGYRLITDRLTTPPQEVCEALKFGSRMQLRRVTALHLADGQPFCVEDRWLNPAFAPAGEADFASVSANEWLVRHVAFSSGTLAFYARPANAALVRLLRCAHGASLFAIDRTTFAGTGPITSVTLSYAPGYRMETLM